MFFSLFFIYAHVVNIGLFSMFMFALISMAEVATVKQIQERCITQKI